MELQKRHPGLRGGVDPRLTGGNATNPNQNISSALPYIVFANNDTVDWAIVLTLKSGPATAYTVPVSAIQSWPTEPYISFSLPLPGGGVAANLTYFYSRVPISMSHPVVKQATPTGTLYDARQIRLLTGLDNPDITANQSAALGSSGLPVYIRLLSAGDNPGRSWSLGSLDAPDITANQASAFGSVGKPVYIRLLSSGDTPSIKGSGGAIVVQDSAGNLKQAVHQTLVGQLNENGSIAGGTGLTTIGTIVVPNGSRLFWSLSVFGALVLVGSAACMTVTGNTSGVTYAVCGPGNSSGYVDIPTGETITFSYQNGDTATNHYMIGGIWVTQP